MNKVVKILLSVVFALILVIIKAPEVLASSSSIADITIDLKINSDGSATVQEVWEGDFNQGTEVYKQMNNMRGATISDLRVKDESGTNFTPQSYWDVNLTREEKKYKSGIIQNGSNYELCFGIGDYGHHIYTMTYTITNFIIQYEDTQGFNYQFVGSSMNPKPQHFSMTISQDSGFNKDNSRIWAFGYQGQVVFQDNQIVMSSTGHINYANILCILNANLYPTTNKVNQKSDYVIAEAKKGSSYNQDNTSFWTEIMKIFMRVILWMGLGMLIYGIGQHDFNRRMRFTDKDNRKIKMDDVDYYREIPVGGNLEYFYFLASSYQIKGVTKESIVSAYLLKWIREGQVTFQEEKGPFNKVESLVDLHGLNSYANQYEQRIGDILKSVAGANQIIEKKEFKRWINKTNNFNKLDDVFTDISNYGRDQAYNAGKAVRQGGTYLYTPEVRDEIKQVLGFKRFLNEFTLIDEKQVIEVALWEEYLIFATILGDAKKVRDQIKIRCPEFAQESNFNDPLTVIAINNFVHANYSIGYRNANIASGGGGGFSSFGGGGGFSGGGGGGVR